MPPQFDAEAAIRYAEELGLQLSPWQADVIRAMAGRQMVIHHPHRGGYATIKKVVDEYQQHTNSQLVTEPCQVTADGWCTTHSTAQGPVYCHTQPLEP